MRLKTEKVKNVKSSKYNIQKLSDQPGQNYLNYISAKQNTKDIYACCVNDLKEVFYFYNTSNDYNTLNWFNVILLIDYVDD